MTLALVEAEAVPSSHAKSGVYSSSFEGAGRPLRNIGVKTHAKDVKALLRPLNESKRSSS